MKQAHRKIAKRLVIALVTLTVIACSAFFLLQHQRPTLGQVDRVDRPAIIHPDYAGSVIPPNIAPLNFKIQEEGSHYLVRIYVEPGHALEVYSRSPDVVIPEKPWRTLLDQNRGENLHFVIFCKTTKNEWRRFSPIVNRIAKEDIDPYLVYRKINPVYGAWGQMGIYQRDLRHHTESLVLDNDYFESGCVNCHSFCPNNASRALIGIRSSKYGSSALLVDGDSAQKIGTKLGYTSWHPSGRLAAYSLNKVTMFFHTRNTEVRDVIDLDSMLSYYLVDQKRIKTAPELSQKDRLETYPTWSPDGRHLYFCSAPLTWASRDIVPAHYESIKYDLVRISYDVDRDQWGKLETVMSAQETGLSTLLPRISPDGRWLLICMTDYGCFPVYQSSSDLYVVDLERARQQGKFEPRRLSINSDASESWHSWSANSRWIAFSSKRGSGAFTRSYICYFDTHGKAYKPLVLPQKDPGHYDSCLWTYSVPELIDKPIQFTREKLGQIIRSSQKVAIDMPVTSATPKVTPNASYSNPWLNERE